MTLEQFSLANAASSALHIHDIFSKLLLQNASCARKRLKLAQSHLLSKIWIFVTLAPFFSHFASPDDKNNLPKYFFGQGIHADQVSSRN